MNNHNAIINNIKPGDILLSRNKKHPVSITIANITKSNWSHVFLYIGEGKIIESSIHGVVINPLSHYLNNKYDVGLFRTKEKLSPEQTKKLIDRARSLLGIKYGFLQVLWLAILRLFGKSEDPDWSLDVDTGMICSEMIAHAYEYIGIKFKDLPPHQIEPEDIDQSNQTIRVT